MMDFSVFILTWWRGQYVGKDDFGNRYYQEKKPKKNKPVRRWVIYKGRAEASKVPAEWHGWLHYTLQDLPADYKPHHWQKKHLPNLTGTPLAHQPVPSNPRPPYEPWQP